MNRTRAVISLGTNSTRLLVIRPTRRFFFFGPVRFKKLIARMVGTRLGERLRESGSLDEEAVRRTLAAVEQHLQIARRHTNDVAVIATSAVRRADNAADLRRRVLELTGRNLHVLRGEEEARYSFLGASHALRGKGTAGVVDIGGGSTEYAIGPSTGATRVVSCEIGAVRLTEAFPRLAGQEGAVEPEVIAAARSVAGTALRELSDFPPADRLMAVGGTVTTAARMTAIFPVRRLPLRKIERLIERLLKRDLEKRKKMRGIQAQRADILPAGLIVLAECLRLLGQISCLIPGGDLLLGYLIARDIEHDPL